MTSGAMQRQNTYILVILRIWKLNFNKNLAAKILVQVFSFKINERIEEYVYVYGVSVHATYLSLQIWILNALDRLDNLNEI